MFEWFRVIFARMCDIRSVAQALAALTRFYFLFYDAETSRSKNKKIMINTDSTERRPGRQGNCVRRERESLMVDDARSELPLATLLRSVPPTTHVTFQVFRLAFKEWKR